MGESNSIPVGLWLGRWAFGPIVCAALPDMIDSMKGVTLAAGALVLALWLWVCAAALAGNLTSPTKFGIALCALMILTPLLLRHIGRLPVYLLSAYAAVVPFNDLLISGRGATITKDLAAVAGATLILSLILKRQLVKPPRVMPALIALTLYVGATIFWAIDQPGAFNSYLIYLTYIALFAVVAFYPFEPRDVKVVFAGFIAGPLAAAAYGLYFYTHVQWTGIRLFEVAQQTADANQFAAALIAPTAMIFMLFLRARGGAKLLWAAAVTLVFVGILLTGSRGSTAGALAAVLFLLWRPPYKTAALVIPLVCVVAVLFSPVGDRLMHPDTVSFDGRMDIWKVGIASLHQYWLAGAGIGNFGDAFSQYFLRTPHVPLPWDRAAHSVLVQSVVEYGVIGLLLVIAVWYYMLQELAHVVSDRLTIDLCTALRAGVVGLFVAGFALDLMMYKYTWLTFSLIAMMRAMLVNAGVQVDPPKREMPRALRVFAFARPGG
jgi:hypothetical protein